MVWERESETPGERKILDLFEKFDALSEKFEYLQQQRKTDRLLKQMDDSLQLLRRAVAQQQSMDVQSHYDSSKEVVIQPNCGKKMMAIGEPNPSSNLVDSNIRESDLVQSEVINFVVDFDDDVEINTNSSMIEENNGSLLCEVVKSQYLSNEEFVELMIIVGEELNAFPLCVEAEWLVILVIAIIGVKLYMYFEDPVVHNGLMIFVWDPGGVPISFLHTRLRASLFWVGEYSVG